MTAPPQLQRLQDHIDGLERERARLLALVEILRDVSGSLHYSEIVQSVVRRLGHLYGLDRCSVLLSNGAATAQLHLVASYEDPSIQGFPVNLDSYPEIRRAIDTGQLVYIPDIQADPTLAAISTKLVSRGVRSITVIPMSWQGQVIGTLFLRTDRNAQPMTQDDVEYSRVVADVTARALRLAHEVERLQKLQGGEQDADAERPRAVVAFISRLTVGFLELEDRSGGPPLPDGQTQELDRLVAATLSAIGQDPRRTQVTQR